MAQPAATKLGPQSVNCLIRVSRPPQFRIRKSDIFGAENEVSTTADIWLQGRIDFFTQPFVTVHFPAN